MALNWKQSANAVFNSTIVCSNVNYTMQYDTFPLLMPLVSKPAELSAVGTYLQVAAAGNPLVISCTQFAVKSIVVVVPS